MADARHLEILAKGADAWNSWRQQKPDIVPDLSGERLYWDHLKDADLHGVNLSGADLNDQNLGAANLSKADLSRADLSDVNFVKAKLTGAKLYDANLHGSRFNGADLTGANLGRAELSDTDLRGANFTTADLTGANLTDAEFSGANFTEASLTGANLGGADLRGARLRGAILVSANLLRARFDEKTNLSGAQVEGCAVDRYALECLKDYGELTVGARMTMDIHDDVATLRSSYSGFLQWIHIAAVIGFLFPYLWFIVNQWGKAKFLSNTSENFMPLWQALAQFIFSGGEDWELGLNFHWSFLLFVIALLYNIFRTVLLLKTKALELTQESSGIPVAFSMDEEIFYKYKISWRHLFQISQVGFYLHLGVVFLNLWHFFTMQIPVSP